MSNQEKRQVLMKILGKSSFDAIDKLWATLNLAPSYEIFRQPEIGLVQLQGKMGGTGNRFFLGDATLTRAVVLIDKQYYGYSYLLGRDKKKAELCALIDAVFQMTEYQQKIEQSIMLPLIQSLEIEKREKNKTIESTRVDFFTLVRGEDE